MNNLNKAILILRAHQKWRQGCDMTPPTPPKELSWALSYAVVRLIEIEGQKENISPKIHDNGKPINKIATPISLIACHDPEPAAPEKSIRQKILGEICDIIWNCREDTFDNFKIDLEERLWIATKKGGES